MKKIVHVLTDKEIAQLKKMTEKLGEYFAKKSISLYLRQNLKIHDTMWKACGNKCLYDTLAQLMEKIDIYRKHTEFHPFSQPSALEKSYKDHLTLIETIEDRNLKRLEQLIHSHWGEEFFVENPEKVRKD